MFLGEAMFRWRWSYLLPMAGLWAGLCSAESKDGRQGVGIPTDWSHKHLMVNNAAAGGEQHDPRILTNLAARAKGGRHAAGGGRSKASGQGKQSLKRDWSVSLGGGRVAPTMSPAKFSFYTNTALTSANCTSDYVVYALDVAGSGTQANLVGLNNLYSGTVPSAGLCNPNTGGTNAATTYWAYNTSTGTCTGVCGNKTSPSISFDATGAKIAFVESASANTACPGAGACSIFHVLTWKANEGTVGAPKVPGQGGSTASMVSIIYASNTNTTSSPWIDYANDAAYVGADDGKLYRITGVFNGTPTLDAGFTMTVNANTQLSPPVQIAGTIPGPTAFNIVLIGDGAGNLWAIDALRRVVLGTTVTPGTPAAVIVGGHKVGSFVPGALDAPLVYYDSAGDPSHISVFATSSSSANARATITNKAAVVQGLVELNAASPFGTFDDVAGIPLGQGATGTQPVNIHAGAFDNTFYTTPTSGFSYFCGTQAAQTWPMLYRIGFNNPLASPRNLVPVLDSGAVSSTAIVSFLSNNECSPLTEFANPNLATTDILFLGATASQKIFNWNITGALQVNPMVIGGITEAGGTSGIIVDNAQTSTSQASSIYFTTEALSNQCGASTMCAIKLRQLDLQ